MHDEQDGPRNPSSFNRRDFIANTAKVGGGLAVLPLLSIPQLIAGQPAKKAPAAGKAGSGARIGVLLPESAAYPGLSAGFLAGMELYFAQANRGKVELVSEGIGSGARGVVQKVQTLVQDRKVDLLAGVISPGVAAALNFALEALQSTLVASNLGENVPRAADHSPYVFHHTLGLWQANWALGQWAAAHLGRRAVLASSFYDSGFDMLHAFRLGFQSAGGQVIAAETTHYADDKTELASLIDRISQSRPDLVFASYCGPAAADFLTAYARSGLAGAIPLAGTAFLADAQAFKSPLTSAVDVHTAFSWSATHQSAANREFQAAYRGKTSGSADAFVLLGYEAAQLIGQALDSARGGNSSLLDALATAAFDSPRGAVSMDSRTHSTSAALYLLKVSRQGSAVRSTVLAELKAAAEHDRQIIDLRSGVKTGWLTPYLFS